MNRFQSRSFRQNAILASALAASMLGSPAFAEHFASAHAAGHCITNASGTAVIQGCVSTAGNQRIDMRYVASENVFFGALKVGGQCLEARGQGQPLAFTACKAGPAQEWKLTGKTAVLNNGQGMCADLPNGARQAGSPIIAWPCHGGGNQKWYNAQVLSVPNMKSAPTGRALAGDAQSNLLDPSKPSSGGANVIASSANVIAAGAGNIVAGGAGNVVAGGAGNIVAGGAGNVVAGGAGNFK